MVKITRKLKFLNETRLKNCFELQWKMTKCKQCDDGWGSKLLEYTIIIIISRHVKSKLARDDKNSFYTIVRQHL